MQGKKKDFQAIFKQWHEDNLDVNRVAHITTDSWRADPTIHYIYRTLHYYRVLARSKSLPPETNAFLKCFKVNVCGKQMEYFLSPKTSRRLRKSPLETLNQANFKSRFMVYPATGAPRRPNPTERAYLALRDHIEHEQFIIWNFSTYHLDDFNACAEQYGIHKADQIELIYQDHANPKLVIDTCVNLDVLKLERHTLYSKSAYLMTYIALPFNNRFVSPDMCDLKERTAILTFSNDTPKNVRLLGTDHA